MEDQESRTRGQDYEEVETPQITPEIQHKGRPRLEQKTTTETPKEPDMYALLQQLSQLMSQQMTQQTELLQKQMREQKLEQSQQTKQLQQLSQQITQKNQVLRDEIATQLSEIKKENNEILQQFKLDTKTMIDEEISTITDKINDKFSDNEKLLKEIDDKHSSDIKILNKKVIATNKRCDESIAAHKIGADKLKELESKMDNHSGETNLKLQLLQSDVRTKMTLINASPFTRSVVNEQIKELQINSTQLNNTKYINTTQHNQTTYLTINYNINHIHFSTQFYIKQTSS